MAKEIIEDPGYPGDTQGKLELVWGEGFLSPGPLCRRAHGSQIPARSPICMMRFQLLPSQLMRVMLMATPVDMVIAINEKFGLAARTLIRGA